VNSGNVKQGRGDGKTEKEAADRKNELKEHCDMKRAPSAKPLVSTRRLLYVTFKAKTLTKPRHSLNL
jgi:hypothetical protein